MLYQGSYDTGGQRVEVYDDTEPASLVQVASVVPLAARVWVVLAMIRTGDDAEHEFDLIGQQRPPELEMQPCPSIEDDQASVGIEDGGLALMHGRHAMEPRVELLPAIVSSLRRLSENRRAIGTATAR